MNLFVRTLLLIVVACFATNLCAQEASEESREVELAELDSIQGHDSFLVDMDRFRPVIAHYFHPDGAAARLRIAAEKSS